MDNRKDKHLKLLSNLEDNKPTTYLTQTRATAIELMAELEDIQGANDDLIETITQQTEHLESVIIRLIEGGVVSG